MKERIEDKIKEIEEFIEFLYARIPNSLEEYKSDLEKKAVCERYVEKIVEAIVDLAFLITKHLKIEIPANISDTEIFNLLANNNYLSPQLSEKLQDAKGMRNIIAHEYGKIDDEIVFEALSSQIKNDVEEFINIVKNNLKEIQ